jgi:uncharacterized protein (DUF58 family)
MIPSRAFVIIALGPVFLAIATLVDETLLRPMLWVDGIVVLLAVVDAFLARKRLVVVERRAPRVMSINKPNGVVLELRSLAKRKLVVWVMNDLFEYAQADELPLRVELPARGRVSEKYRVVPTRRGAYSLGNHTVRYSSPLGLWIRELVIPAETPIRVYPDIQQVRAYELSAKKDFAVSGVRATRKRGGESEFERLREYRRGDEFRSIDWKATARNSKLISREYQMERNQNVLFLLDAGRLMTAETNGLSLFDHAINATLKSHAPCLGGPQTTARIVQAAYHLHPELTETNFNAAVEHVGTRVKKRTLVVVFTQIMDEVAAKELLRLLRGLLPKHLPLFIPLRDVELETLAQGGGAQAGESDHARPYIRAAAAELISFHDRLLRDLRKHGALVIDTSPMDLTPALINRYLEIKARQLL